MVSSLKQSGHTPGHYAAGDSAAWRFCRGLRKQKERKMRRLFVLAAVLLAVTAISAGAQDFIVESRSGGLNFANYFDTGFADSSGNVTAPGCTGTIGSRYSGTGLYFGPTRYAQFSFTPSVTSWYQIDLAWPSTAGQISTAVNLYTGAAVGSTTDIWGNTNAPDGIIATGTMDMYYVNTGVWNTFTTAQLTAGTTYNVGIYGGYATPYAGGATPADALANRVASGAVKFSVVPEPGSMLALGSGLLGMAGMLLRRKA